MNDARFTGCRFISSRFVECLFLGKVCDFSEDMQVSDVDYLFYQCDFGDQSKVDGALDEVEFYLCRARDCVSLFYQCTMFAKSVNLAQADLRVESLDITIGTLPRKIDGLGQIFVGPRKGVWLIDTNRLNLSDLYTEGRLKVETRQDSRAPQPTTIVLNRINFAAMSGAEFRNVNLEWAHFREVIIGDTFFINCKWPKGKNFYYVKNAESIDGASLSDEDRKSAWKEMDEFYGQLRKNFEKNGSYADAGHWHFREMEARRKVMKLDYSGKPLQRLFFCYLISLSAWYKGISNYGESQKRPIVWILGILFVSSFLHMFTGFKVGNETVQFQFAWPGSPVADVLAGFLMALICSVSIMTFQVGKLVNPINVWGIALTSVQVLLTLIVVPLFLLAVRRKFRR